MCTLDSDDELGNLLPAHSPSPLSLCEAGHSFILSLILLLFITQTQAETFFFFFFYSEVLQGMTWQLCLLQWTPEFLFECLAPLNANMYAGGFPALLAHLTTKLIPNSLYQASCSEGTTMQFRLSSSDYPTWKYEFKIWLHKEVSPRAHLQKVEDPSIPPLIKFMV